MKRLSSIDGPGRHGDAKALLTGRSAFGIPACCGGREGAGRSWDGISQKKGGQNSPTREPSSSLGSGFRSAPRPRQPAARILAAVFGRSG